MKELMLDGCLPKGFKFVGTVPCSIMSDESCLLIRYDIERKEEAVHADPYAELKAQFLQDEESLSGHKFICVSDLYQCSFLGVGSKCAWIAINLSDRLDNVLSLKYRRHPRADSIIEMALMITRFISANRGN